MANFADVNFLVWEATASLKQYIEVILRKGLKQSYCEILESVPAGFAKLSRNFHPSLSGCSALAGNDKISPVCRYIIEKWTVLMACTWKNRVLLAVFLDKISMFHLGQTKHCSARCDGPLCALHSALISIISFWPLGNENSLFCTTEWLYIHVKTAFFPLSVWQIVQGGWKLRSRPRFDSWQFAGQAEKWRSAEIANFENLRFFYNLKFLIQF